MTMIFLFARGVHSAAEIQLPLPGVIATVIYMTYPLSFTGRESWRQPRYAMLGISLNEGAFV